MCPNEEHNSKDTAKQSHFNNNEGERDFDGFSLQDTLTLINDQGNSLSFKKKQTLKRKLDDIQYYQIDLKIIEQ